MFEPRKCIALPTSRKTFVDPEVSGPRIRDAETPANSLQPLAEWPRTMGLGHSSRNSPYIRRHYFGDALRGARRVVPGAAK